MYKYQYMYTYEKEDSTAHADDLDHLVLVDGAVPVDVVHLEGPLQLLLRLPIEARCTRRLVLYSRFSIREHADNLCTCC